ncbi:iron-containing alcohol dehydrogenase [Fictibacillus sp. WQ 8-8]|uniref:iron-containing alcohol dehydrogenase n=1 Tax=Fictibacillus sp. WQ 8-8 TaxID=2938788 RepID=UPI00210BDC6A|nr:iron-containing alcohol dehydrogenase [Fictibacillus sp. WQ 8-8]MCQ6267908.1 iron-containing alcohol dehydrogenase [Fictibacillus sp. WQ 8-8]
MVSVLQMPRTILYGQHSFKKVGEETSKLGNKALIISDRMMEKLMYVEECQHYLTESGISSVMYLDINSEPTDTFVYEALEKLKAECCNVIIGLGGGSCIDTAKAVAVLGTNGGSISDYMNSRKIAQKSAVPLIAIPTTAGTGSEATDVTIITDTVHDIKMMIKQPAFMPAAAIVDPVLTISSPKSITAATGIDALTHAIEAYLSRRAHPFTDSLAFSAIGHIMESIRDAYHDPQNIEAKKKMSLAALQAGMAFSNASVCLVHGMSRPIGALFHVPHGISNAMLFPAVLEYSLEACYERLADIGNLIFKETKGLTKRETAQKLVEEMKALCLELDIPSLKGWGIKEEQFLKSLEKMARDALASGSPGNNPRVPDEIELMELYKLCYDYQFTNSQTIKS